MKSLANPNMRPTRLFLREQLGVEPEHLDVLEQLMGVDIPATTALALRRAFDGYYVDSTDLNLELQRVVHECFHYSSEILVQVASLLATAKRLTYIGTSQLLKNLGLDDFGLFLREMEARLGTTVPAWLSRVVVELLRQSLEAAPDATQQDFLRRLHQLLRDKLRCNDRSALEVAHALASRYERIITSPAMYS